MNKKYISALLSILLIFSIAFAIAGCNKNDNIVIPNESTDAIGETEQTIEESSIEETESVTDGKVTEKPTESTSKNDESKTESSTKPTETTTENKNSDVCENCGGIIIDNSASDLPLVGNYCDGYCDEWIGELDF